MNEQRSLDDERSELEQLEEREQWHRIIEEYFWPVVVDANQEFREKWDEVRDTLDRADEDPVTHEQIIAFQESLRSVRKDVNDQIAVLSGWLRNERATLLLRSLGHDCTAYVKPLCRYLEYLMRETSDPLCVSTGIPYFDTLVAPDGSFTKERCDSEFDTVRAESPERREVTLQELTVTAALRSLAQQSSGGCSIEVTPEPELALIRLPYGATMQRWIGEFVRNAVFFAGRGNDPMVCIRASIVLVDKKEQIEVTVADTGPGMSGALLEALQRGESVPSSQQGGTGVGAQASARNIRDIAGGTVAFDSFPGVGTTVTIRIPLHELRE